MGIFGSKNNNGAQLSEREILQSRYGSSCNNILLVVALTVLNIVLLVTSSNTYFLFSAYVPFFLADLGMLLCGMYPAEYYAQLETFSFLPKGFLAITLGIAAVILLLYVLAWVFSKKQKRGWLIFALVLFIIDTVAMFAISGFMLESVLDYVIHIWVIVSLVNGITTFSKLKNLPEESEGEPTNNQPYDQSLHTSQNYTVNGLPSDDKLN